MLNAIGEWLGTRAGFWSVMAASAAFGALALFDMVALSTWALSEIALVLPMFILYRDHCRDKVHDQRDIATHKKLDALLRGVDKADDRLVGIEEEI